MAVLQYHGSTSDSKSPKHKQGNEPQNQGESQESTSEFHAEEWILQGKDYADECVQNLQSLIRENPRMALFAALGAGFVLRRLPVGKLIGVQLKLTASLIPPAIFAFGAAKVYEALKKSAKG